MTCFKLRRRRGGKYRSFNAEVFRLKNSFFTTNQPTISSTSGSAITYCYTKLDFIQLFCYCTFMSFDCATILHHSAVWHLLHLLVCMYRDIPWTSCEQELHWILMCMSSESEPEPLSHVKGLLESQTGGERGGGVGDRYYIPAQCLRKCVIWWGGISEPKSCGVSGLCGKEKQIVATGHGNPGGWWFGCGSWMGDRWGLGNSILTSSGRRGRESKRVGNRGDMDVGYIHNIRRKPRWIKEEDILNPNLDPSGGEMDWEQHDWTQGYAGQGSINDSRGETMLTVDSGHPGYP